MSRRLDGGEQPAQAPALPAPKRKLSRNRRLVLAAALIVVFVVGIALGEALNDGSGGAGTQTLVRTLKPLPVAPAARETVTVTVQNR